MPIGLQLYTVRDHVEKDLVGTFAKVAAIGFREVELGSFDFYGKKPTELRHILDGEGLKAVSLHYLESQLKSDLDRHIADALACGVSYVGLNMLDEHDRKSIDAIRRSADWFNKVGETARRAQCQFFYHGHNFDFATVDGAVLYDELIKHTDPKLVNFELDCFWCVRAGMKPVDYFHKFPGRFSQLHIKDLKVGYPPTTSEDFDRGPFTEVGHGVINWKEIFRAIPQAGVKHFYVEQDECERDSLESARISFSYINNLTV